MHSGRATQNKTALTRFLFHYRTTLHSTTGLTPAEMLMGCPLCTHLDLLKPDSAARVKTAQDAQKRHHDEGTRYRSFSEGDPVFVKNFGAGAKWIAGKVISRHGSLIYGIDLGNKKMSPTC